jgi:hypothetical protein
MPNILQMNQTKEEPEQIIANIQKMEERCSKLRKTVEKRIQVATQYLDFIKRLSQFRNLATDLQELFKSLSGHGSSTTEYVFEQHVHEKMQSFEKIYKELAIKGQSSIVLLKNVSRSNYDE